MLANTTKSLLRYEVHSGVLDENGLKRIYEAQEDFSDTEDDLRAIDPHLHVFRCFYTHLSIRTVVGLMYSTLMLHTMVREKMS